MAEQSIKGASLPRRIANVAAHAASGFVRRDPRKIVCGSWFGHKFADNPKYFALHVLENRPDLTVVWVGRPAVRAQLPANPNLRFVEYGTWSAARELSTAKFCFVDHGPRDLGQLSLVRGAVVANLGHGVTLKVMGVAPQGTSFAGIRRALARPYQSTCFAAASEAHRDKLVAEWGYFGARRDNVFLSGQPRNDFLITLKNVERAHRLRRRLEQSAGLPSKRRWVLYMPTFRDLGGQRFSFAGLTGELERRLHDVLDRHGAVILEKGHPADTPLGGRSNGSAAGRILDIGEAAGIDTQEILGLSDLLVTDYSGCFFDYLLLDRPVVHYAYDVEEYSTRDRGLYYDLGEVAGGQVVQEPGALIDALEHGLDDPVQGAEKRASVRERLLSHEVGTASEWILDNIVGMS